MGWAFFIQGDHSVPVSTGICSSHHLPPPLPPTVTSTTNHSLLSATTSAINTAVIITIGRGLHYQPWLLPPAIASSITHAGLHTQPRPLPSIVSTPNHSLRQPPLPSSNMAVISNPNCHHQAWSLHQPWDPAQLPLLLSVILTCHWSLVPSFFLSLHYSHQLHSFAILLRTF